MGDDNASFGGGLLRGLKKLLFNDEAVPAAATADGAAPPPTPAAATPAAGTGNATVPVSGDKVKNMKLKVLELLEKLNQPGCDFFEVWNAASEMGAVNAGTIKAAYTSLRFADKSLDKNKLITTGNYYAAELKKILETEAAQRQAEKQKIEQDRTTRKAGLAQEIQSLQATIEQMKQTLLDKQHELQGIDDKYLPAVNDINEKIATGQAAVQGVLDEMKQVMDIIHTEIS